MSRPTKLIIKTSALLHNLMRVKQYAPGKKIIAMIKANAYGCGVHVVAPIFEGHVDAFGVACIEEALTLTRMGIRTSCIIFQGIFQAAELQTVAQNHFEIVLHQSEQLHWLLNSPLSSPIKIWVKINTGMNRLGFEIHELPKVMRSLERCSWVDKDIGLMTHLACADEPERIENFNQIALFNEISFPGISKRSIANSAAIMALTQTHADLIRPGIMLYGVSPFVHQTSFDLGLRPVMHFLSAVSAIHHIQPYAQVGYQASWHSDKPSIIGIVAAGYGDGYPRHIKPYTKVWIKGNEVPIVGRVSMDTLAVDLTLHPEVSIGETVELWGDHILVENLAQAAGTSAYELLCQTSSRVRQSY